MLFGLDPGTLALVISLGTLLFAGLGFRQTSSRDAAAVQRNEILDLQKRMVACEHARDVLAAENQALMRQVLGLPAALR